MSGLLGLLGVGKRKAPAVMTAPEAPAAPAGPRDEALYAQVAEALEGVRPALQADGGDLELVDVQAGGLVLLHLTGACVGCPMSRMTLKQGIEAFLKETVPGVTEVEAVEPA